MSSAGIVDVSANESDQIHCKVRDYLVHSDGSMRFDRSSFFLLPRRAMKKADHDAPGFWEALAEKF